MGKVKTGKEAICRKALELILLRGYQNTSLNDIAEALSVTKGAVYHHFKSKEDLYGQALEMFFSDPPERQVPADRGLKPVLEEFFRDIYRRREEVQKLVGSREDHAIILLYSFLYEATRKFPEFQDVMDRRDHQRQLFLSALIEQAIKAGEIRKDLDPDLTAFEIEALMQQLIYLSFVNPRIKKDEEFLLRLFDNYWKRFLPPAI